MTTTPEIKIERDGDDLRHAAGHSWRLTIAGKYVGMYDTKRQAREAAAAILAAGGAR